MVYFRFPLRNLVFWMIFVTLMLPVEVRILPTYKVVSDLGLLNTYAARRCTSRRVPPPGRLR